MIRLDKFRLFIVVCGYDGERGIGTLETVSKRAPSTMNNNTNGNLISKLQKFTLGVTSERGDSRLRKGHLLW